METTFSLQTWNRFVHEGVLDSSRINKRLAESWYRSREAQVNPHSGKGRSILPPDLLNSQKEKYALLQTIAQPHLDKLKQFAKDLGMIALLIDPEGYVLSMSGSLQTKNEAAQINFVEGVRWTEDEVGTNAIGTALLTEEPIMVTGSEHYSVASHRWSCAAAPIRNDDGKLLGILDVSCPVDRAHPYTLGMVSSVAYTIERELSIRSHRDEMELMQQSMDLLESDKPVIICSTKQTVVSASKPIRQVLPGWQGLHAAAVAEYGYTVQMEFPVISRIHGGRIGTCIYLLKQDAYPAKSHCSASPPRPPFQFRGEAGVSKAFQRTLHESRRVAPTDATVYLLGETGTGKEVIARSIHENSPRKNGPFVAVNCGAIPKELMESELFGYAEGAFTGARRSGYKGKFEQANHGTLFLDEIGEIPPSMQVALLRVLQERKVTPLGSLKEVPLNIRIIAATHRDLRQLVDEGKFREDLYYRLHVYPINVPPLRERKEDIPYLVRFFSDKFGWNLPLTPPFWERLMEYHWPGNIRELMNVLERQHILNQGEANDPFPMLRHEAHDPFPMPRHKERIEAPHAPSATLSLREKIQLEQMTDALQKTGGNVSKAAKLLGVPRSTFYKRLQKFKETTAD
ncbi:sigma-54-dependent Fis family transcriptional regulator [Paenibacillus ginsengihumi]|uniref:sigma-54-dependent Fis family transcriptional regulator n=1 Tax=Paenibacillus ginsengihumi TaxID=431596 RepID=UPI00035D352E|nr:sigma-54-dependent Fis family transcriptional regulator [Paenibacillus ginsengihumi]